MNSESPASQANPPIPDSDPATTRAAKSSRGMNYKSALTAVMVGLITMGALRVMVWSTSHDATASEPPIHVRETAVAQPPPKEPSSAFYESVMHELTALAQRLDEGLEELKTYGSDLDREIAMMVKGMRGIQSTLTDIGESNRDLKERLSTAEHQLEVITREVQTLNTLQRKLKAKPKPRVTKVPPFQVDAIDRWDDTVYVAVSHAGHVAFLRVGEQQSGWRVKSIDRVKGRVGFRGPAGQHYSATVRR